MHIIAGKFICKPEHKPDLLGLVEELLPLSRAEAGCISYSFYEDKTENNHFLFFEEWESRKAIDMHFKTPHFQKFMEAFPPLIVGDARIKIYESTQFEEL